MLIAGVGGFLRARLSFECCAWYGTEKVGCSHKRIFQAVPEDPWAVRHVTLLRHGTVPYGKALCLRKPLININLSIKTNASKINTHS